jgi:hypothetical protein
MTAAPARSGPIRWISVGAFATWLFLLGTTYGYLPGLRHAWGFNLLRYQPDWIAWLLTGLALLITTEEARRGVIAAGRQLATGARTLPARARDALLFATAFAPLWLLRDQILIGDSRLLLSLLVRPDRVGYPEPGGHWVLDQIVDAGQALQLHAVLLPQIFICTMGAATVVMVAHAARLAAPGSRAAATIPLLAFSGGIAAALAGRIEIQAFVLAAGAVYLWSSLRFLAEERSLLGPGLALGIVIWLQPFTLLLLPSLGVLARARGIRRPIAAVGVALLPLALHLIFLLAVNPKDLPAATVVLRGLGSLQGWVRLPGGAPGYGTHYVLLSGAHLKYLGNAGFVLSGGAIALAAGLFAVYRKRLLEAPPLVFLAVSAAGLVVASLLVRPVWGPYDWDLFSITGLTLAFLAGTALSQLDSSGEDRGRSLHLVLAIATLQLCFIGVPMIAVGRGAAVDAGPFVTKRFDAHLFEDGREPAKRIAPWL